MSFEIEFAVREIYDSHEVGITIETTLRRNDLSVVFNAKVDTGAEFCLFARELGEKLDIDVENGYQKNLSTLAGNLSAFGHYVELETLGLKFDSLVYFAHDYALNRNLLGRQGWLQLIRFGLDDYRSEIYVSPNQENF
jgi:hypothetical protein